MADARLAMIMQVVVDTPPVFECIVCFHNTSLKVSMDLSANEKDSDCNLCSLQSVQYAYGDVDKHDLFHKPCRECDDGDEASSESLVTLCDRCRHLRIRHVLLCSIQPKDEQGIYLRFDSSCVQLEKCALCQFIASSVPADEEVEIRINDSGGMCFLETRDSSIPLFAEKHDLLRRRVSEYVQWGWLQQALKESNDTQTDKSIIFSGLEELRDMRVIDVSQACVAQLPNNSPYAALSYVWGPDSGDQLQASVSNIHSLEQPGSLEGVDLPTTILDAMTACRNLDLQFLWVDRMCILQDDTWAKKSVQLNQMAAIYAKASLTLVAAAGDGASYGLPGVSRARTVTQKALRFNNFFGLIYGTKNLEACLSGSKWYSRGWTYQEHMASSALLFFTEDGLHFQKGYDYKRWTVSEGPAHNASASRNNDLSSLAMIEVYSRRSLTFPTDILRALAGSLSAVYGDRISFGMPWDHFDRAILWKPYGYKYKNYKYKQRESSGPHVFPSWSWTSVEGQIEFEERQSHVYRLAYWGIPTADAATASTSAPQWVPIEVPAQSHSDPNYSGPFRDDYEIGKVAALAWLNGCIRTDVPDDLRIDCSDKEYTERLKNKWPDRAYSFWQDVLGESSAEDVFRDVLAGLKDTTGRLLVQAQKASLNLDWDYTENQNERLNPGCTAVLVRTNEGRIAGSVLLSEHLASRMNRTDHRKGEFIALSVSRAWFGWVGNSLIYGHMPKSSNSISPSKFYGCPCSLEKHTSEPMAHIVECPEHDDFNSPIQLNALQLNRKGNGSDLDETYALAFSKHVAGSSYFDIHGGLLHDPIDVPQVNVMWIGPSTKGSQEENVYRRIGIGKIYLKRWVEASPTFQAIALE